MEVRVLFARSSLRPRNVRRITQRLSGHCSGHCGLHGPGVTPQHSFVTGAEPASVLANALVCKLPKFLRVGCSNVHMLRL
jgi:hypothetical protein